MKTVPLFVCDISCVCVYIFILYLGKNNFSYLTEMEAVLLLLTVMKFDQIFLGWPISLHKMLRQIIFLFLSSFILDIVHPSTAGLPAVKIAHGTVPYDISTSFQQEFKYDIMVGMVKASCQNSMTMREVLRKWLYPLRT